MCLAVPARVEEINGREGRVSINGNIINVALDLLDNVKIGDYVLVHTGFALEIINKQEAEKTIEDLSDFHKLSKR